MREQIIRFLAEICIGKKSDRAVRELVATQFGGTIVRQYVKIDGIEYLIVRDPDCTDCGFNVTQMYWTHNNDWRFYSPY